MLVYTIPLALCYLYTFNTCFFFYIWTRFAVWQTIEEKILPDFSSPDFTPQLPSFVERQILPAISFFRTSAEPELIRWLTAVSLKVSESVIMTDLLIHVQFPYDVPSVSWTKNLLMPCITNLFATEFDIDNDIKIMMLFVFGLILVTWL